MSTSSFFKDLRLREIDGFRVKKRPYVDDVSQILDPIGALAVEHRAEPSPPMALSFCKTKRKAQILALTDEGGYVTLFNTRQRFMDFASYQENSEKAKLSEWVAHDNAIFDLSWIKDDTNLLTASGDQSIKVWDTCEKKCIRALMGHTGSIKSISCHPTNQELIVSGSRDGSFAIWDIRYSKSSHQKMCSRPTSVYHDAHTCPGRRRRRGKAESMSITSVLYLKDEVTVATAGAVDSIVKFWDTRHLKAPVTEACPNSNNSDQDKGMHGISSLSQDLNGVYIAASCMDHRIYLYNLLHLEKGPEKSFSKSQIGTFFVKSQISPDASHILSGSSDGNAYIWQVDKPHQPPVTLTGHSGEVTAVDWCLSETGKLATCSDDFTACLWDFKSSCYSSTRSPLSKRKRISAFPKTDKRTFFTEDDESHRGCDSIRNALRAPIPKIEVVGTPESQKKKGLSFSFDAVEDAPAAETSPVSVLQPPSSLKRKTIRDYFQEVSSCT